MKYLILTILILLSGCEVRKSVMFDLKTTSGETFTMICPAGKGDSLFYYESSSCFVKLPTK